jgi:hypothetical protein
LPIDFENSCEIVIAVGLHFLIPSIDACCCWIYTGCAV